jgi:hypothetical protein
MDIVSFVRRLCANAANFDWVDLIEYCAFRLTLLISFIYTLYQGIAGRARRFLKRTCQLQNEQLKPITE